MEPFIVNNAIEDVESLFGRSKSIETLISCAKRRENAGIIGARRFGKTCLLKSMRSYLESHPEINALPVYFDVKSDTNIHKCTPEVFYTLAALLAKKMCETGILKEGKYNISRRCILDVSTDLSDMIVQMSEWNSEYQKKAFFNLVDETYNHGKYVLLLLDEIDSLLLDAFEEPSDFGRIRGLATDKSEKLTFWIAGTSEWKSITTSIGSPELNCGLVQIRLHSLEKNDFSAMWKHECSLIGDDALAQLIGSLEDDVYDKTGGIPYFAKFVGSSFMNGTIKEMPDYGLLREHLAVIFENRFMSETERSALKILAKGPKSFKDNLPDGISSLFNKGLIEINDCDEYYIAIRYLADYVNAISSNEIIESLPDIESDERNSLVDEIIRLRNAVNKSYINNPPFLTSTEDPIEFNNLKNPCVDESSLYGFATSLYKLYYEGSGKGRRLPLGFYDHDFIKMITTLRHKCDHRDCESTDMEDIELYKLINNGRGAPISTEHFSVIQFNILKLLKDELVLMSKESQKPKQSIDGTPKQSKPLDYLVDGEWYEGKIVEENNYYGGTQLKVKCNQYPYPLQIKSKREELYEGEEVKFQAGSEPNSKDSSKTYWYARDVYLKE